MKKKLLAAVLSDRPGRRFCKLGRWQACKRSREAGSAFPVLSRRQQQVILMMWQPQTSTTGEAASLVQGSWAIAHINGSNPDFESKCGVFQFPGVERVIAKSDSLAMSSSTKNPEA
ncbi:MAG: hypothetical protein V8S42_04910 [Lachnospiraceae bacterium]